MDLLIGLTAAGIITALLNKVFKSAFFSVISVVAFSLLVLYLIAILFLYYTTKAEIKDFLAVESEFQTARSRGKVNPVLQFKVNESNEWLIDSQEWNRTLFELCIPDEVDRLNPIR